MKLKLFIASCLLSLPLLASAAEITITNNTDSYGTGKINGTCSTVAGDAGIINPGQTLTVPQAVFDLLCFGMPCTAEIYLSKNCTGKMVASAEIDPKDGIMSVDNRDKEHFMIDHSKTNVTVTTIKKLEFFNF